MKLGLSFLFKNHPWSCQVWGAVNFFTLEAVTPNSQDARKLLERNTLLINKQRVMMAADTVMPTNS